MTLELSRFVETDLDEIAAFIAEDNPARAVSFIQEIRAKFSEVHRTPLLYRLRPEIGAEARVVAVGNYVIMFRVMVDRVRIERVVYGGRLLPDVFNG